MALSDKKANIFVGFDFKYHMKLSTSGILYLERLTQNTRILKFDSSSIVNIYIYIGIYKYIYIYIYIYVYIYIEL